MKLNVGCGRAVVDGWVNVDIAAHAGVDVRADLDQCWPFADGTFTQVLAWQVFEHVERPVRFMDEAHRVLRSAGVLVVCSPWWQSENAFTDPTHRRACTLRSFDYWTVGTPLFDQFRGSYGTATFRRIDCRRVGDDVYAELEKVP